MKSPISRARRARLRLEYLRELSRFENSLQLKLAKHIRTVGKKFATLHAQGVVPDRWHFFEERLTFHEVLKVAYRRVAITFAEKLKRSMKSSDFERALQQWINEKTLRTIDDIDDYTLTKIRRVIRKGLEDNLDVSRIATLIEKATSVESALPRARTIARTELHDAMNHAQIEAAKATGLTLVKTWTANIDDRTRDAHAEADGQTVPLNDNFIVDGENISRPGEGSPSNAINCRCTVVFAEVAD